MFLEPPSTSTHTTFGAHYHLSRTSRWRGRATGKSGSTRSTGVHVQGIHPEVLFRRDDVDCPVDILGNHSRFIFRVGYPSPAGPDEARHREGYSRPPPAYPDDCARSWKARGLNPAEFDGRPHDVRPALFRARREFGERNGLDYDALADEQLTDDFHYFISRTSP